MKITILDDNFNFLQNDVRNNTTSPQGSGSYTETATRVNRQINTQSRETQYDNIRRAVAQLFHNESEGTSFYMTKTHQNESFGIYKALVSTNLLGNERFIVAIVPNDTNIQIGSIKLLQTLKWVSFQTRESKNTRKEFNNIKLQGQYYMPSDVALLKDKIHFEKTNRQAYVYMPDNLPLQIEIIPLKEDDYYSEHSDVISALNIFSTVLNLK